MLKLTLEEAIARTQAKGFRLLSKSFRGSLAKHRFSCALGHEWEAAPNSVWRPERGCPRCAGKGRLTIDEVIRRADARGLIFRSPVFDRLSRKYPFECRECGHAWAQSAESALRSGKCPKCAGKN